MLLYYFAELTLVTLLLGIFERESSLCRDNMIFFVALSSKACFCFGVTFKLAMVFCVCSFQSASVLVGIFLVGGIFLST